jgi:hypothetical protein
MLIKHGYRGPQVPKKNCERARITSDLCGRRSHRAAGRGTVPKGEVLLSVTHAHGVDTGDIPAAALLPVAACLVI